jgi:hypothetical protein
MAKTKISEFDTNPDNNTDINSINIAEGCAPSGINNAIRQLMSDLKEFQTGAASDPLTVGGVATFTAGSASAPAITTTGDTNTGIFFPAADTIAFSEGGAEAMRLDSSGNLGLGVTPNGNYTLQSANNFTAGFKGFKLGSFAGGASGTGFPWAGYNIRPTGTADSYLYEQTDPASALKFSNGINFYVAPSGTAGNAITFTQAMTLDASGNLGLGVTPSAWGGAGVRAFQISGFGSFAGGSGSVDIYNNTYYDGNNFRYISGSSLPATRYAQITASGEHQWYRAPSGTAGNVITFTQPMTLDASGNLLVGCTSGAQGRLAISGSGGNTGSGDVVLDSNASYSEIQSYNTKPLHINRQGNNVIIGAEGGILLVTRTSQIISSANIQIDAQGNGGIVMRDATANGWFQRFYDQGGSQVGSISRSGSSTVYSTSSDYRLKENIAPMTGALDKVAQLKPCTYVWKSTGEASQGFIAHELAEVIPDAVIGEKDAVNEDGSIAPQGIDTSFLVATLTAAIQEQQAIINDLKARIESLENK